MNFQPHMIRQLNADGSSRTIAAMHQIATVKMNRPVAVPYLAYMPEIKRLAMLVTCDYPHRPAMMFSDDLGETWTDPARVFEAADNPNHLVAVGLTYLGRGRLVFNIEEAGRYFSDDFGQTWNGPHNKPAISNGKTWCQWDPFLVDTDPKTHDVTRLWETGWNHPGEAWLPDGRLGPIDAYLRHSDDLGQTWSTELAVPQWAGCCEVALVRAANGHIVAACRTETPEELNRPIPEIDHYTGLGISISADNGLTWSAVHSLYTFGRHHPSMVTLADGHIVMSYVVRKGYPDTADGFPQFGIEAVVSSDHGQTWDLPHRYILAEWVGNRRGTNAWWASSQATSTILLPSGELLTAYGTGYRSEPNEINLPSPRDIGVLRWTL